MNILQLGDDTAKGLGLNTELTRVVFTALAAVLSASAVSVAGLLGFVGLIVPHVARLLSVRIIGILCPPQPYWELCWLP